MEFKATHRFFKHTEPTVFTEDNLPAMFDHKSLRWWFDDYVFKLPVGGTIDSDFQHIERIA